MRRALITLSLALSCLYSQAQTVKTYYEQYPDYEYIVTSADSELNCLFGWYESIDFVRNKWNTTINASELQEGCAWYHKNLTSTFSDDAHMIDLYYRLSFDFKPNRVMISFHVTYNMDFSLINSKYKPVPSSTIDSLAKNSFRKYVYKDFVRFLKRNDW